MAIGLGFPNLVTTATTVSGGLWSVALPASNVRTRDYSQVARSSDALTASTQIRFDHGSAKSARVLYIDGHNLSSAAQVRWSRGTTSGGSDVAQIALRDAWQITPLVRSGRDHGVMMVLPASYSARYDLIEIQDTGNAAGYVEVARIGIFDLIVPTYSASYGLQDKILSLSGAERSPGGSLWLNQQRALREVAFALPYLSLTEGDSLHEVQRAAGMTEEVLYVPDLADQAAQQRFGFIGTLAEMSAVDYPYYRARTLPLRITQAA